MAILNKEGFDKWAGGYDTDIPRMAKEYPFDGYYRTLAFVHQQITVEKGVSRILDIGIGTGLLSLQLYEAGAVIYGMDFSEKMLQLAGEKMPNAVLVMGDFANGLPPLLSTERFHYIISSYALHHIDDAAKVKFLNGLKKQLLPDGKIIIADISFETTEDLEQCRSNNASSWDHSEFYMVAKDLQTALTETGFQCKYQQISSCGGCLVLKEL